MTGHDQMINECSSWWYCDNIVNHPGQIGFLHMGFPRVFILLRDGDDIFADFERFRDELAEVNFLDPSEREGADIEELLRQAYNFLVLQDEEEERLALERMKEDDECF